MENLTVNRLKKELKQLDALRIRYLELGEPALADVTANRYRQCEARLEYWAQKPIWDLV